MSFELMAWAVKQKLPANKKIVLLLLSNRTNNDTKRCTPRIKLLAEDCGMSETTCKACLKSLSESGHITVVPRFHDGIQGANQYIVNSDGVGRDLPGGGSKSDPGVGRNPTTETGSFETGKETTSCQQADDVPVEEIFNTYERVLPDKPRVKLRDEERKKAVRSIWRRDKRFQSIEFWEKYFKVVSKSTWLMSKSTFAFDWLMKPANFKKVVEGNYDNA